MTEDLIARIVLVIAMAGGGALLLWLAHATASGKVRRNFFAGIRLASTLASDEAWLAGHRAAKSPTIAAAWCGIVSGLVAVTPVTAEVYVGAVLVGCVAMLALILHAARLANRAAKRIGQP